MRKLTKKLHKVIKPKKKNKGEIRTKSITWLGKDFSFKNNPQRVNAYKQKQ